MILILQTQKYYYQCKMLEKAANSSNLATQVLAQWKIEKCENFTYLRRPFLVKISPALIFLLCVLLLLFGKVVL